MRQVSDNELLMLQASAAHYVQNARRYVAELRESG
jgi:hypothetical protein